MSVADYGIPLLLDNTKHLYEMKGSLPEQFFTMNDTDVCEFQPVENQLCAGRGLHSKLFLHGPVSASECTHFYYYFYP